jgi:protein SCO1/2
VKLKTALTVSVLALGLGAAWFQWRFQQPPLPKYRQVPPFTLTERTGAPLRLEDLKGKVWLADFIYTTCPGPCPMLTSRFSSLQGSLLKHDDVRLVSISINPAHDTPEVLREYARHFHASDGWLFLTGEPNKVRALVTGGFMQTVIDQPGEPMPIVHSTRLVLVDRAGVIRAFYDGSSTAGDEQIARDIARLRRE